MYTNHSSPDGLAFGLRSFLGIELRYPVSVWQAAPPVRVLHKHVCFAAFGAVKG
jgi:hypothetical protein